MLLGQWNFSDLTALMAGFSSKGIKKEFKKYFKDVTLIFSTSTIQGILEKNKKKTSNEH